MISKMFCNTLALWHEQINGRRKRLQKISHYSSVVKTNENSYSQLIQNICNFPMLDVETKNGLFKVYCRSHYGSELRKHTNNNLEAYYIAWRKSLRRLWSLPYNSSQLSTALASLTIPLFDEICRRVT